MVAGTSTAPLRCGKNRYHYLLQKRGCPKGSLSGTVKSSDSWGSLGCSSGCSYVQMLTTALSISKFECPEYSFHVNTWTKGQALCPSGQEAAFTRRWQFVKRLQEFLSWAESPAWPDGHKCLSSDNFYWDEVWMRSPKWKNTEKLLCIVSSL